MSIFLVIFSCFVPFIEGGCTYVSVSSGLDSDFVKFISNNVNKVPVHFGANDKISVSCKGEYFIRDGKLYLLVQSMRYALILVTSAEIMDWNSRTLKVFKKNHPKLNEYWKQEGLFIQVIRTNDP